LKDLYLSQWQNYINEHRKQQLHCVLQLGQGKSASRLLVREVGVYGMAALLVNSTSKRVLLYMVTNGRHAMRLLSLSTTAILPLILEKKSRIIN
jgi:hypothetical protein